MCTMLSAVQTTATNVATTVANTTVSWGKQALAFGGRVIDNVRPALAGLVTRIQAINFSKIFANAWTFLSSKPGLAALLAGAGIGTLAYAASDKRIPNVFIRVAAAVFGIATLAAAAVLYTNPFTAVKA